LIKLSFYFTGVNEVLRKIGNAAKNTICVTENNGVYTLTTTSQQKSQTLSFKLGEEIEETTVDGRKVKVSITKVNDLLC
jgi:hypothetical protein